MEVVGDVELVAVEVEQVDVGAHADGDGGGVHARDAGADDDHAGRAGARHAAHEDAAAAFGALEVVGAGLDGEASGDLAHGRQERQATVGGLDGLVGDGGDAALQERVGAFGVGGEVEVGEEGLAGPHPVVLGLDGLFDLEDEVARGPGGVGVGDDGGPGFAEVVVGDGRAEARSGLDGDVVARGHQFVDARGRQGDTVLVVLDLAGDGDFHGAGSFRNVEPVHQPVCDSWRQSMSRRARTRGFPS